jgi:uncharacterized OsmC-like protein
MTEDASEVKTFDVTFELKADAVGKMRTEIAGQMTSPVLDEEFHFATDEGPFHGGDQSAPPPLAYFCTGLVACLMTQLRAFAKRLRIDLQGAKISASIKWQGEVKGREPYIAKPNAFELDIDLKTSASLEDQKRLLEAAKKGCFVEAALANPVAVIHRLKQGDTYVDAD